MMDGMQRHLDPAIGVDAACIGLFANGEGTAALQSRIEARQTRNDLLTAEASKLGPRHLRAGNLHLRNERRSYLAFAPDESSDVRNVDGAISFDDDGARPPSRGMAVPIMASPLPVPSDAPPALAPGSPGASRGPQQVQPRRARPAGRPNAAQLEAMLASSRARSGNSDSD